MTQLRRVVRALHFVPCCILHTYSIGCAASQRNNIATIHHTSTVNKTSGSSYHPRSLFLFPAALLHFLFKFFAIYSLHLFPSYTFAHTSISLRSFSLSDSNYVFAMSAYLFDFFFPPVRSFARPLFRHPFLRVSFSSLLLASPLFHPPVYFFYQHFHLPPRAASIPFSLLSYCSFSLSGSCPVSTPRWKKSIHVTNPVDWLFVPSWVTAGINDSARATDRDTHARIRLNTCLFAPVAARKRVHRMSSADTILT